MPLKTLGIVCQIVLLSATTRESPELIIANSTGPFVFEANTTSEVFFSFEDAGNESLTYTIFINHKILGSNVSRLKCFVNKADDSCSSSNPDCECLNETLGYQYRLKKVFQEEDSGEWTFSVSGKGISIIKTIKVIVMSLPAPVLKTDFFSHVQTSTMIQKLRGTTVTTTKYSNDIDGGAARNKDCDDIFLIIVITCVVVVIVVSLACVLLIISVRCFINRFLWEHRHCLLSTDGIKLHADSLCELLTDRLQAETSFSRSRYSRPRKRRRSATLDDSSDNISYMCITDDDHGTYLTPADNDQREEAPILT